MHFCIADQIMCFDSRLGHRALPRVGSRISIVAFQHPLRGSLSPGIHGRLKQLGFSLDAPRSWRSPVRTPLDTKAISSGACMYVGLDCKRLGLRGSFWSPHWKQGPGVTWRHAADIMSKKLAQDAALGQSLRDLEGRFIACTCALGCG